MDLYQGLLMNYKIGTLLKYGESLRMMVISEPDNEGDQICLELDLYHDESWGNDLDLLGDYADIVPEEYLNISKNGSYSNWGWYLSDDSHLYKRCSVANTELAKFMHPDAEESEDGKYLYI